MTLSPRNKNIMIGMLCFIIIVGVLLVIMPVFLKKQYPNETLQKLEYSGENILVIKPRFTEAAYGMNGFYDYYDGMCDKKCLTIPLQGGRPDRWSSYNLHTVQLLQSLKYPIMDDSDIHQALILNPGFLNKYDTIILLHSEYVTKELYQAITNHKHVIYLAPNALYAEISYKYKPLDHTSDSITLIRGHNYPTHEIKNGFGWKDDNSPEEYDLDCTLWKFRQVSNGEQLSCVQEIVSQKNPNILLKMKELIDQ